MHAAPGILNVFHVGALALLAIWSTWLWGCWSDDFQCSKEDPRADLYQYSGDESAPPPEPVLVDVDPQQKTSPPPRFELPTWVLALDEDAGFVDGIQVGSTTPHGAIFWTRFVRTEATSQPPRLVLRIWRQSDAQVVVDEPVDLDPYGFVHHKLTSLEANTLHGWGFFVLSETDPAVLQARSPVGRFKTAPGEDELVQVRFAGTHGTNGKYQPFLALEKTAEYPIDFFLHTGDVSYNDGSLTREDFHARYSANFNDPGYRAILSATTFYAVWDDHEISDNWNPETFDEEVRQAGIAAYFDYLAIERHEDLPNRIWTRYRWGKTAELFLLDCRSERRPSTRGTDAAQLLSREQLEWLKRGLSSSDAIFKLIVTSVPITDFAGIFELQASDRWEGYSAQREELLGFIVDKGISHVYFLTGDLHFASVHRIESSSRAVRKNTRRRERAERWSRMVEIIIGPGGSNPNPLSTLLDRDHVYFAVSANVVTLITLNPVSTPPTLTVTFVALDGRELYSMTFSK